MKLNSMAKSDSGPRCRIRMACAAKPSGRARSPGLGDRAWSIIKMRPKFKNPLYVSVFKRGVACGESTQPTANLAKTRQRKKRKLPSVDILKCMSDP